MPLRVPPADDQVHELEVLLRARHPLLLVETVEEERLHALLDHVSDRLNLPLFSWTSVDGLRRERPDPGKSPETMKPEQCLSFIERADLEGVYHLRGLVPYMHEAPIVAHLKRIATKYARHRGTLVVSGPSVENQPELEHLFTQFELTRPSPQMYRKFVSAVLRDLASQEPIRVKLNNDDVSELLSALHGLTFFEVQKIITQAVIEDGVLDRKDIQRILDAKKQIIQRSGVLEYFPHEHQMEDIAGLVELKAWLQSREAAFRQPEKAADFGLSPPRGLLLIGVQGCGKSLCAKAVASAWRLPLIRLDPSNLYHRYVGESEKNLQRAIKLAEEMAPCVLWIDEVEKAFGEEDVDGGPGKRIFGTFLAWLQEKKQSIFVIATANNISKLPPEFLRKGRFDEIFFVDLPARDARRHILEIHLRRRNRDPLTFDLDTLADQTDGFSGAELEQAIVSALYTVFSRGEELTTEAIAEEITRTKPLSVTMSERIDSLRAWAMDRAVPAG